MQMPFGKYRGQRLGAIPASYLEWVLANCDRIDPSLFTAIDRELDRRRAAEAKARPTATGLPAVTLDGVVAKWYRELVLRHHPDRGGTTEVMQALNDAHERLRRALGLAK